MCGLLRDISHTHRPWVRDTHKEAFKAFQQSPCGQRGISKKLHVTYPSPAYKAPNEGWVYTNIRFNFRRGSPMAGLSDVSRRVQTLLLDTDPTTLFQSPSLRYFLLLQSPGGERRHRESKDYRYTSIVGEGTRAHSSQFSKVFFCLFSAFFRSGKIMVKMMVLGFCERSWVSVSDLCNVQKRHARQNG